MTSKLGFKSWHATSCISVPLLPCSRERQTSHTHIIALYQHLSGPRMLCGMPWCLAEHLRLSDIGQHAQHGRAQAASAASSRRADSPIGDEPALMCSIVQPYIAAMLHSTSLPWGGSRQHAQRPGALGGANAGRAKPWGVMRSPA